MAEEKVSEEKAKRGRPARSVSERSDAELNASPAEEKVVEGKRRKMWSEGGKVSWFLGKPERGTVTRETR